MTTNYEVAITQNAFRAIEQLAALLATPGVDEETNKVANTEIREIIKILHPELMKIGPATIKLL